MTLALQTTFRIESCLVALASEAIFHSYLMNFTILSVEYLGCSWKQEMHPQFQVISPRAESGLGWMMSTAQHCKNIKLNEILILHIICTFAFYSSKKNVTCAKEMSLNLGTEFSLKTFHISAQQSPLIVRWRVALSDWELGMI